MNKKLLCLFCFSSIFYFNVFSQTNICPGGIAKFTSDFNGSNYNWQVDSGYGFVDIDASSYFTGNKTIELAVVNPPTNWYNHRFRCVVDNDYSNYGFLTFSNKWVGGSDNRFTVAANWGCGVLPDKNTDVIIDKDTVVLDSDVTVRSLNVSEPGSLKILPNVHLILTGKDTLLDDFNLTEADIAHLDTCGIVFSSSNRLKGNQLLGLHSTLKGQLIEDMLSKAEELVELKTKNEYGPYDTTGFFPPHNKGKLSYYGLAYRFGGREFDLPKAIPTMGDDLHRNYELYGFDCVGFVMALLNHAGYSEINKNWDYRTNTNTSRFKVRTPTFLNQNNDKFRTIKLVNKGYLAKSDLQSGDMILWENKTHIGVIGKISGGTISVYNSNGEPHPKKNGKLPKRPFKEAYEDNIKNWGQERGSHPMDYDVMIKPKNWTEKYIILRFEDFEVKTGTLSSEEGNVTCMGEVLSNGGSEIKERGFCWSKKQFPKPIIENKCINGVGLGNFSCSINTLEPKTIYFFRAYAVNMTDTSYGEEISFTTDGVFTDPRDGQVYPFKQIGTQVWMTKNLNYDTTGSWCYNNNQCGTYGRLYDWNTAQSVAPTGWHIPSEEEWNTLANYLGGASVAGGKMKATTLWRSPNVGASNSSGFTGLPGGGRFGLSFLSLEENGLWWSTNSSSLNPANGRSAYLNTEWADLKIIDYNKSNSISIRCIKD